MIFWFVGEVLCQPFGSKSSRPGSWNWPKFFFFFFSSVHFRLSLGDHNHVHNAIIMLGRNDACQQNVVLFELVEEILFDVEALSISYSSLVEPWHVAMSCWRYSSPKVLHFQKASVLSLEPQTSSTGEMAFPWGQLWQVFAEPVRAIVDSMARVVHSMRKGCPKTESTWMREAVHWSPFFLHFLESIIESFFL